MNNDELEKIIAQRLDPRIKALWGEHLIPPVSGDVDSREQLIEEAEHSNLINIISESAKHFSVDAEREAELDEGLIISEESFTSSPDGNTIKVLMLRNGEAIRPCVYYIHGGAMQSCSCFENVHRVFGKRIARAGVHVAMVDFRNAITPSSSGEIAPFPAGLKDCVSGLRWLHKHADQFGINAEKIIVAGESGGANLSIASLLTLKQSGGLNLVKGLYALCPYILGQWPGNSKSAKQFDRIQLEVSNNRGAMGYGIEAFKDKNPLAWPGFATTDDVSGFPPSMISVNELDPLRDEGVDFYRLLLKAGVQAQCLIRMGTSHGSEVVAQKIEHIAEEAAGSIAHFCRQTTAKKS